MRKIYKICAILLIFVVLFALVDLCRDKWILRDSVIRLHVVGASDNTEDQRIKLQVKDAVIQWISSEMVSIQNAEEAQNFLTDHIAELQETANYALQLAGVDDSAIVTFEEEPFPLREYDTFTLPSGVYRSLRIRIGPAQGRNWWCVVFPSLCLGATQQEVKETAVSTGFDSSLADTITEQGKYEIRFFLLDCLGMLENFFHQK